MAGFMNSSGARVPLWGEEHRGDEPLPERPQGLQDTWVVSMAVCCSEVPWGWLGLATSGSQQAEGQGLMQSPISLSPAVILMSLAGWLLENESSQSQLTKWSIC